MTQEINKSGLPPLQEVVEQVTMRIITVNTNSMPKVVKETTLTVTNERGHKSNVVAPIIEITDSRVQGFMPSKIWWNDSDDSFDILFYVNNSLPKAVRPFKDKMYLMSFYPQSMTVEYDVNVRLFLDQIKTNAGMAFVVMFGDESYKSLVIEKGPKT
jgi:hypothetical protein